MSRLIRLDRTGHTELASWTDDDVSSQEAAIEAFRRELDAGMWAAVPTQSRDGRREAELVKSFEQVPRTAERVIFFPRAAGGAPRRPGPQQRGLEQPAALRRPTR
jgi:hypothetical protein